MNELASNTMSGRIHVVFLINWLDGGGAEKQVLLFALGLAGVGFTCSIYTLQDRPLHPRYEGLWEQARAAGVQWHTARKGARLDLLQILKVRQQVKQASKSVLWMWGHRGDLAGLAGSMALPQVRRIFSLRDANEVRIRRYRQWWSYVTRRADLFISNSQLNIEQLERYVPGSAAKARVIYNALTTEELASEPATKVRRPERLRVVMLGNLIPWKKGYDQVVELAALIRGARLQIEIVIGGRAFDDGHLERSIIERSLGDILKLAGPVLRPREFLAQGHLFLMASRVEGTPNALLEAMSLALPAVCTRVGDVSLFARDRVHLRLVEIGDAAGMLRAIQESWDDWPATLAMGEAGARLCRTLFTKERMTQEAADALRSLFE